MSRSAKRLKGQHEVHEKDSFDYTAPRQQVERAASTPSVRQGRSADADAMLRFAGQFNQIQHQATGLFAQRAEALKKKGETSALKGEDQPRRASDAFMEGFETQQGEAAVADYMAERDALQAQAANLDPKEYEAQSEAINKKFLLGAPDNFIRGFVPGALRAGAKYDLDYQALVKKQIDQQYLTDVRKKAYASTKLIMDDPTITNKSQAIRDLLTAQQLDGKRVLKADRNTINMEFIETMGAEAIRGGNPDLMAFTTLKDKDDRALIDDPHLADKINQIVRAAEAAQTSAKAVQDKAADDALKLAREAAEKGLVDVFSELSSSVGGISNKSIISFHNSLFENREILGTTFYEKYRGLGVDLVTGNGFAFKGHTDTRAMGILWDMASDGRLDDSLLDFNQGRLDPGDYMQLLKHRAATEKFFSGEEGSTFKSTYNTYVSDMKSVVNQVNPITGRLLDPIGGPQRQQHAYHVMTTKLNSFRTENPGKYPSMDTVYQWTKESQVSAFEAFGDPRYIGDSGTEGETGLDRTQRTNQSSKRQNPPETILDRFRNRQ